MKKEKGIWKNYKTDLNLHDFYPAIAPKDWFDIRTGK
jgi:hypothetical protein